MNMLLYRGKLLSNGQLKRLSDHLYSCENIGLLDPFLQPFWNSLTSKTPLWLAPNLITVTGLLVNIITTLVLVWYSPDAKTEPPRWACLLCAIGLFIYQSLDAIDGKQARRTGTSSPLGELFDHGCDSISTVFVALSACIAVQLGQYPTWMFFQCFCAMTLFYCAHWQTYVSGTMKFGRIDVTEAQCAIILIHIISAIFGPNIWMTEVDFPFKWELRYLIALVTVICCSLNLYEVLTVIMTGGVGKNGSTVAIPFLQGCQFYQILVYAIGLGYFTWFSFFWKNFEAGGAGKNGSTVAISILRVEVKLIVILLTLVVYLGLTHAKGRVIMSGGVGKNGSTVAGTSVLSPIIPFSLVIVPAYIIYKKSETQLYENHPALYILAFGMVSAKVTNRLVVAHMTKNELDYLDTALIGPAMLFLNQYFNFFFDEYYVLWSCLIWVTLDLLRYSCEICQEICDHLKIELFRIPAGGISGKSNSGYKSPSNGQQQSEGDVDDEEEEEEELLLPSEEMRRSGRSHHQGIGESNQTLISFGNDT